MVLGPSPLPKLVLGRVTSNWKATAGEHRYLALLETEFRAQGGITEVGDGLVVTGILDGEGLGVELRGELGALRRDVAEAKHRTVDAGAELEHPASRRSSGSSAPCRW